MPIRSQTTARTSRRNRAMRLAVARMLEGFHAEGAERTAEGAGKSILILDRTLYAPKKITDTILSSFKDDHLFFAPSAVLSAPSA